MIDVEAVRTRARRGIIRQRTAIGGPPTGRREAPTAEFAPVWSGPTSVIARSGSGRRSGIHAQSSTLWPIIAPPDIPHPVITEVLYAVPTYEGDANLDGARSAVGDEFIELMNPHDEPINLRGYALTDRNAPDQGRMRFVFPELVLKPGEVAVVFNGLDAKWVGPVGDDAVAPPGKHDYFRDAYVFTMRNTSELTGLGNSGDWVLLSAPDGSPIQCIKWGRTSEMAPIPEGEIQYAPDVYAESVVLDERTGKFVAHTERFGKSVRFSPGWHEVAEEGSEQEKR